ncbi:DAK2 domain-containing protein [Brachybacterium sp. AOP43-C2-M15]|uniref:DAK2 domain-containing protein n=1 Tax=Brachybacterium sp. AOP43-C2-M15 TaxID=3457661 RepID=UPI004034F39F
MTSPEETSPLPDDFGRTFVDATARTLGGSADALGDLDRRAGDGDFGANVRTAMKNLAAALETDEPAGYREWVTAMSRAWLGVGGTSGPLFGMFFRDLAKAGYQDTEGQQDTAPTPASFAEALAAGQAVIQKYGEAEVGDKTMVDALAPAVTALREAVAAGQDPVAALTAAEQAAVTAAQETAGTTARRGRASYVGEAAQGVIDPGAAAMALVLGAARAAAEGGGAVETDWIG